MQQISVQDATERALRTSVVPPWAWALALLLAGLVVTAALVERERWEARRSAEEMYRALADSAQVRLREPLEAAAVLLRALQTVFLSNDRMDADAFAAYHHNLRLAWRVPGHVMTGFAYREPDPADPARTRYPYSFVTPLAGNEALLGFDIAMQPANLAALEHARDADVPTVSAPFQLVQFRDAGEKAARGVTVRLPVYSRGPQPVTLAERRARELGALAVSLRLEPMVRETLEGRVLQFMHVEVRDLDAPVEASLVFGTGGAAAEAYHVEVREMEFGGRRWEVRLWPRMGPDTGRAGLIAVAGTVISVLAALLLWSWATTHRRAVELGRQMSARFGESEARFRALNELLPALVLLAEGGGGRITYANQAARERLGEVVGAPLARLFMHEEEGRAAIQAAHEGGWDGKEAALALRDGGAFWAKVSLTRVEVDRAAHLLMVAIDISEQRGLTELLRHQAAHDELTGLCNRREFERRVQQALAAHAAGPARPPFALMYIDLDQFKLINDLSGHMAGDQLLVELVWAMRRKLRPEDVLARLGGDEFGVLAFDVDEQRARTLAEDVRRCIEDVMFAWQGRTYAVTASIGIVLVDRPGVTLKDLLAWADSACYQAKENGRNRVHVYRDDADASRRQSEMEWANRLRAALEQGRLLLDYQEVVPLRGGGAPAIELLLRLNDEEGRVVPPGAFLPAAERYGLMPQVDRWVIREALAHFDRLHPSGRGLHTCAINLSGASIEDEGLADFILASLDEFGVEPSRLCLEITETVAVRNLLRVIRVIERLRAAGCRIALDDFGAGMSSFGYLKNLPADVIKIDGSFVRDLGNDPVSRTIVGAIVQIGHLRGMDVVAEWVDSEQTLDVLHELRVDRAQGFLLHRPERVVYQRTA